MRTIQTILYDDNPSGVKTIEFTNRLIKGVCIPRIAVKKLSSYEIEEVENPGIYILVGEDEDGYPIVYIGQTTSLQKRLDQHTKKEDFWQHAIIFTNKGVSLDESDINYLEAETIKKAKAAGRATVINKTDGNTCLVAKHKKADLNEFLSDMEILLGSFGYDLLKETKKAKGNTTYYITDRGSQGKGEYTQDGFIVYKGSTGPKKLVDSQIKRRGTAFINRPKLIERNIIKEEGDSIIFLEDYTFNSPSGAAIVISGQSANGWKSRKTKDGKTLEEKERI